MVKKVGYARSSTMNPDLLQQMKLLKQGGCRYIFPDQTNVLKGERPRLQEALKHLSAGDILVVCKLKVLGHSLTNLIETIGELRKQGIGFKSLQDKIDTTDAQHGDILLHIFNLLADYEREVIRERTQAGLVAARARGKKGGRPQVISAEQIAMIKQLHADKNNSITSICKMYNISRPTLYAYLKR
jgi:DNA invertase Pin-like site-specific DNA recombinase